MTFYKKIVKHISYRIERFFKHLIIRCGYRGFWEKQHYNARLSTLFISLLFQKIFRLNGDVPWPVHFTSRVTYPKRINIGEKSYISFLTRGNYYIQGKNGIVFGKNTIFAPGVMIVSANHDVKDHNIHIDEKPIKIGDNCWIGTNAVILPGVEIGNNVTVGAGSVVTKNFQDSVIIAGNPARVIKNL